MGSGMRCGEERWAGMEARRVEENGRNGGHVCGGGAIVRERSVLCRDHLERIVLN
jgi:hypothetical protein